MNVDQQDIDALTKALSCYKTYQDMIEKTGVKNLARRQIHFEIFQEDHEPPISDLSWGLK
jgi:hypothetical protein